MNSPKEQNKQLGTSLWKNFYKEWGEPALVAFLVVFFIIRPFFLQAFKIPTGSMIPTLLVKDRLIVDKWTYGARVPFTKTARLPGIGEMKRGDIIVFKYPEEPKKDYIKRLIAFGGETVEIRNGDIYIDGKEVDHPDIKKIYYYNRGDYGTFGEPVTVPKGSVYVLGDNSASSADSRYWGFVPEENIIGRADLIFWPIERIRFLFL
ncbi:MAG: signal peptidase I [Candidatus Omnitrophota bacterium]